MHYYQTLHKSLKTLTFVFQIRFLENALLDYYIANFQNMDSTNIVMRKIIIPIRTKDINYYAEYFYSLYAADDLLQENENEKRIVKQFIEYLASCD